MRYILTDDYISICSKASSRFEKAMKGINYEPKGIFNSEMLLVCAVADHLGVNRVIESGRARGYSTIVLLNYFRHENDFKIDSIEYCKYTADAVIVMKRLAGIRNLRLSFGNSFDLLSALVSKEPCVVLIDGPKGRWATLLACMTLRDSNAKAVFIHDMHKIAEGRELTEKLSPKYFLPTTKSLLRTLNHWMKNVGNNNRCISSSSGGHHICEEIKLCPAILPLWLWYSIHRRESIMSMSASNI